MGCDFSLNSKSREDDKPSSFQNQGNAFTGKENENMVVVVTDPPSNPAPLSNGTASSSVQKDVTDTNKKTVAPGRRNPEESNTNQNQTQNVDPNHSAAAKQEPPKSDHPAKHQSPASVVPIKDAPAEAKPSGSTGTNFVAIPKIVQAKPASETPSLVAAPIPPPPRSTQPPAVVEQEHKEPGSWVCKICSFENTNMALECVTCGVRGSTRGI